MSFDTGSAGVYLVTDGCKNEGCANVLFDKYKTEESNYFTVDKSLNSPNEGRSEIQYGKGSISGTVAADRLCFSPPPA